MSIRRCGHSKDHFFIELGRSAITGAGEIYMATEGTIVAQNMHETVLRYCIMFYLFNSYILYLIVLYFAYNNFIIFVLIQKF